ncbi:MULTISPECIES: glucose 1-dehydrogenase [unclassified Aureimonas]|uniref:glucose 1-dehydrogenase n=1 Tax=unclassified Aureimonas TaxID=2615206 RepID=UPI0006FF7982|nr:MULTISPECIES: glucose 1-dehydrogenase [unclassified Aureimonas]KQT52154.1 sugar dehydrogenase [Aureimonas sp. Leaf427]KQT70612.1 sugar dehydrogenase [Aureimonas sp. Leaf460]
MASFEKHSLVGQVALVTGASAGIGRACAIELARAGADVVVNHRHSEDEAKETAAEIEALGQHAVVIQADVSVEADIVRLFDQAEEALGPLDIVVSNAGLQKDAKIGDMTLDDWNAVISVNLTGGFLVGREAIKRFRKKGVRSQVSPAMGKLIFDSSVHQVIPWAFHVNYAASKGGLHLLMQSLAQEVSAEKIRVNAVAPGAIATAINAQERARNEEGMLKLIPYGRIGEPADIGRAVAFLASDASDYMTGQTLFVDGGMTLYPEFRGNG